MIPDQLTLVRIRAQADAYAWKVARETAFAVLDTEALVAALRTAYLAGADAGFTATKAEERKP